MSFCSSYATTISTLIRGYSLYTGEICFSSVCFIPLFTSRTMLKFVLTLPCN